MQNSSTKAGIGSACAGSALTMLAIGKSIKEAWKITKEDVLKELDGLPESHCAELAVNALHKALEKIQINKPKASEDS